MGVLANALSVPPIRYKIKNTGTKAKRRLRERDNKERGDREGDGEGERKYCKKKVTGFNQQTV